METVFIVNPSAASGRSKKKWSEIEPLLGKYFSDYKVFYTEFPNHAQEIVCESLQKGTQRVIAVGGDGTINEVLNGFFAGGKMAYPEVSFGILQIGTGADFSRSLNFPTDIESQLKSLATNKPEKIDVGYARFLNFKAVKTERAFLNILEFGIGGTIVDYVNNHSKLFGGFLSFYWAIVRNLLTYKNKKITFQIDDESEREQILNNFVIANGKYFGGGIKVAPEAQINDGRFNLVLIGDISLFEAITNLSRFRKGTHLNHPKITGMQALKISALSAEHVFVDMDGECVGTLPLEVYILPKALNFIL